MLAHRNRALAAWRRWRRTRPFWGGAFALTGGLVIMLLPANHFTVLTLPGIAGLAGFLLGGLIAAMGLLLWFLPDQRVILGIAIVLLAIASFVYTNLGGYLLGMLFAIVGGCLGFAWTTNPTQPQATHRLPPSPTPRRHS